jgi:hypothetical protein
MVSGMDKRSLPWIGGALIVVGLIWMGQGLGFVGGSMMSDSLFWAAVGLLVLIAGVLVLMSSLRGRRPGAGGGP